MAGGHPALSAVMKIISAGLVEIRLTHALAVALEFDVRAEDFTESGHRHEWRE